MLFVTSWIVAGALRRGYDPLEQAISRLAELDADHRWIVTTGMIAFGIGATVFAPALRPAARVTLLVAGIASFGVAAFPCSSGCPAGGAVTDLGHAVAAGLLYIAFALTPVLQSRAPLDLAATVIGGMTLVSHVGGIGPSGLMQRIGLTTLDAWMVLTAVRLLVR